MELICVCRPSANYIRGLIVMYLCAIHIWGENKFIHLIRVHIYFHGGMAGQSSSAHLLRIR